MFLEFISSLFKIRALSYSLLFTFLFIINLPFVSQAQSVWTEHITGTISGMEDFSFNGTRFVGVGGSGRILTSLDGSSWTIRSSGVTETLNGVVFGDGRFVAVGKEKSVLTSSDGVSWTVQTSGWNDCHIFGWCNVGISDLRYDGAFMGCFV